MKTKADTFLLFVFLLFSCTNEICKCNIDDKKSVLNDSLLNVLNNSQHHYYGKNWVFYKEPHINISEIDFFRVSWKFKNWDDSTTYINVFRVSKLGSNCFLTKKKFISTASYPTPDSLVEERVISISSQDYYRLAGKFDQECFWGMGVELDYGKEVLDGSLTMIEGRDSNSPCYRQKAYNIVVGRYQDSSFVRLRKAIMSLDK